MEVGTASFKIAAIGTKMAGEELRQIMKTNGPIIKQEAEKMKQDFKKGIETEKINTGQDIKNIRAALNDPKN